MKMVCENRRVVEDFVLYKISQYCSEEFSTSNRFNSENSPQGNGAIGYNPVYGYKLPKPQNPPNEVNKTVRLLASEYEDRYKSVFQDLLEQIRAMHIAPDNIDFVFTKIVTDLFQIPRSTLYNSSKASPSTGRKSRTSSPALSERKFADVEIDDNKVKWPHVIGLLVFAGLMAVRCIEVNNSEQVDAIVLWVTNFLDKTMTSWLKRQGGWNGFVNWYTRSRGNVLSSGEWWKEYEGGLHNVIKYGAIAALGVGAFMMSRK